MAPGLKVDLPQGRSVQQAREGDAVVIVTQDGKVYYRDEQIDLTRLQSALHQVQQEQVL